MNITYSTIITSHEVNNLRASVGFRKIHPEQVQASLDGSSLVIAAYTEGNTIGMARLIWDGGYCALIKDVLVVPEYQMKGIEVEILTRILDFLRSKLKPGFGIQVDVNVWNNKEHFYENLGFQVSTHLRRGVPMHICLTNKIELTDAIYN